MDPKAAIFIVTGKEEINDSLHWLRESAKWDVKSCLSVEDFLDTFDPAQPGCLLLDAHAPKMGGLALQEQLRIENSALPIIFASTHGTVPEAVQALHAGAADFLVAPFKKPLLLRRLKASIELNQRAREVKRKEEEIAARLERLTTREREVMQQVIKGKLNKLIASDLGISIKTVEIHRARVMKKLQVRSQVNLIHLVAQCSSKHECRPSL